MTGASATVIVVTYNSAEVIEDCLGFLRDDDGRFDVIVVDNASTDESVARASGRDQVTVIENTTNAGFARAVNLGVEHVPAGRAIVLLNPDAVIDGRSLGELVDTLGGDVGIVAPVITQPGGRLRIASAGRSPHAWRMFTHFSGLSRLRGAAWEGHYLRPTQLTQDRDVDWSTGACLAIAREAWDAVGGLTERWFMYAEDILLCDHVRAAGYRVVVRADVRATHVIGHSSRDDSRVNASWVVNLYDYFSTELARGAVDRALWKTVVVTGLTIRAAAYGAAGVVLRAPSRRSDARRFLAYAGALARAPRSPR